MNEAEILRLLQSQPPSREVAIYALWEEGQVVYVGSAKDPDKRFASHLRSGFRGRAVSMEILCWVTAERRDAVEKFAIKAGLNWGYPLENIVWRF